MSTVDELISKVRSFLKRLPMDSIRNLSCEEFAGVLGVDPKQLPLRYKMEMARMLYDEFHVTYKWISDKLAMSFRDINRAVRGVGGRTAEKIVSPTKVEVDVVAKAIQLLREGKIRNPNDLVLELKVDLEQARNLFDAIVENEKVTIMPTVEAAKKIERSWRSIAKTSQRLEDVDRKVKENVEWYEGWSKSFLELLKKEYKGIIEEMRKEFDGEVRHIQNHIDGIHKDLFEIHKILATFGVESKTLLELIKYVQGLREDVENIKSKLNEISKQLVSLTDSINLIRLSAEMRLEDYPYGCKWLDKDGYCAIGWSNKIEGCNMKPDTVNGKMVYKLNAKSHPLICVACPYYEPRGSSASKR